MYSLPSSFRSSTDFGVPDPERSGPLPSLEIGHFCWYPPSTTSTSDNVDSATDFYTLEVTDPLEHVTSTTIIPDGLESALESVVKRITTAVANHFNKLFIRLITIINFLNL